MTQTTLTRVLEDIKTLELNELWEVERVVRQRLTPTAPEDPDEKVLQAMLEAGLITEIKRPDHNVKLERPVLPIQGKPLSETIIEERR